MSVSTLVVGARQPATPPATAAATTNAIGPKIQFATPLYDFGRMKSGEPVKYTYEFTNTGDALLIINNVQPQCGCTAAGAWTKEVAPGSTGKIPIQFNTMGYNGPVFKQVTVTCNVTNQAMLFLQLKGTVYKPYDINPQMAVFNLAPDAAGSASTLVTITNNMEEPLLLSAPEVNNHIFSVELVTNVLGKGYQLKVSTVPPIPAQGSTMGQATLKTSWANTPTINVPLMATVQPEVVVNPLSMLLPPGPLPRAQTNVIVIDNNTSASPLTLSEPKVSVEGVGVVIRTNQPGKSFTVMLGFPQGFEISPTQQVDFSLQTSNPKFPQVKVTVKQMARPPVQAPPQPAPAVAPAPVKKVSSAGDPPSPPPPPLPSGH